MALSFGLRSAPFIFSSVADLLEWILRHNYGLNFLLHHLDDFYTLGPPNSPACQYNLDTCIQLFKDWHIPPHPDKVEGPSTCLTVLGIELDSLALQGRLPRDKFERIVALLESWSVGRHCSKKELEFLISHCEFFISWDRLSFLLSPIWASLPDFSVSSDAAGALGYGAISGHDWFVGKWSTA